MFSAFVAVCALLLSPAAPLPGAQPYLGAHPVVRAKAIYFGAGGGFFIQNISWHRLTPTSGTAVGTVHANDCVPSCALGTLHTQRANLTFSKVTAGPQPYFNCLLITYSSDGWITRTSHERTVTLTISDRRYNYCH
jgi:hypothetical protein